MSWLRKEKALVAGAMLAGAAMPDRAEPQEPPPVKVEYRQQTQDNGSDWGLEWPGAHFTFFKTNEQGDRVFNWESLAIPAQVELSRSVEKKQISSFDIPYEYARLFAKDEHAGDPLRAEDYEKMSNFVDQKLKEELADVLYGLDFNEEIYRDRHGKEKKTNLHVNNLRVTGFASPEGPVEMGPETLVKHNIDPENIDLAKHRAKSASNIVREKLTKMGVTTDFGQTLGIEQDFTDQENFELDDLAMVQDSDNREMRLEKIFNLVREYNDGTLDNARAEKMDKILAEKRKVQVELDYEGKKKEVLLIPISWLYLLPLAYPLLRRNRRNGDGPENGPRRSGGPLGMEIPRLVREIQLPEPGTLEYMSLEERALVDDLAVYLDDPDVISRGINYGELVVSAASELDNTDRGSLEQEVATAILREWRECDRMRRSEAGISAENLDKGLDYENQSAQVRWAKMHARLIVNFAERYRNEKMRDISELRPWVQDRASTLHARRVKRSGVKE